MFVLVTLVYPVILAVLCLGGGLLVDRLSGGFLPAPLLPITGVALLIAISQLTTYVPAAATATPYVLAGAAAAGFVVGHRRALALVRALPTRLWPVVVPVVAYLGALAPVLLAGRLTFSGYGALPDSALHMIGADYLIRHGQDYAHLDLRNSYGQYIAAYFATSYPSGSHTFFGGSAKLLGLPLIWALQSFCAFILATATGPAWVFARRVGLTGALAALAALTVTVPALVYGFELVASLKELATLPLILALGALVVVHERWLRGPPNRAIPFALVTAAGVSALGVAFGPWAVAAVLVLAGLVIHDAVVGRPPTWRLPGLVAVGAAVGLVAAWPTWLDVYGSLQVAQGIASTTNPGNLTAPLHLEQVFGAWLAGSYRHRVAMGPLRDISYVLIAVTVVAALLGIVHVIRVRAYALTAWAGLLIVFWLGLTAYGTTWTDAKLLMLTSPVVMLLAWAGVAGLRASPRRLLAPLLALTIAGGVIASDVTQYHGNDLAPTARYAELAYLDTHYAGQGPALFTDFDEWSLYQLRDLDVGGPDFIFPPVGMTAVVAAHGDTVDIDRISPTALAAYPLIVTRRDPAASRPPAAYRLAWEGRYYQLWTRSPGAPAAFDHYRLSGLHPVGCATVRRLARVARARRVQLVTARPTDVVKIDFDRAHHPQWIHDHPPEVGLLMHRGGHLTASFTLPHAGFWNLWLQGEIMPAVRVSVDGRRLGSAVGEVSGNAFNTSTAPPFAGKLAAGGHRLTVSRGGLRLAPGDGGSAILHAVFLTTAGAQESIAAIAPSRWRSLCGGYFDWIEVTRA
ncbi:MAG: hypothetical protein ACR2KV_02330 [Solirubrobacteraceae bacterium]